MNIFFLFVRFKNCLKQIKLSDIKAALLTHINIRAERNIKSETDHRILKLSGKLGTATQNPQNEG